MQQLVHSESPTQSRLDVMNFLNEMAERFPKAISFVSGRPSEAIFDMEQWIKDIPAFVSHHADRNQLSFERAMKQLAQYGRTNGIMNDLIARQVGLDEGIDCSEKQVLVTAGCQEAMDLCIKVLCETPDDVIIVRNPTYIGITGAAELNGVAVHAFEAASECDVLQSLRQCVEQLERAGKRARILYLVPDFDNPTGQVLSLASRKAIIAYCAEKNIVILEDNPYGMFRFDGDRVPTMQSLDADGCVVYLGTYSKTICPTLRIGFVVVPQRFQGSAHNASALLDRLSQAKSFSAVNTSQITQAMAGGVLLAEGCSLQRLVMPALVRYKQNRDTLVRCLDAEFAHLQGIVHWNIPAGGFFLNVTLPFEFKQQHTELLAQNYDVLVMPLSFFALNDEHDHRVRFAYSNITDEAIAEGVRRFGAYVKARLQTNDAERAALSPCAA